MKIPPGTVLTQEERAELAAALDAALESAGGVRTAAGFLTAAQFRRLAAVERDAPSRAGLFRRVYLSKATPRQRIKAFCLDCCGFRRDSIAECNSTACPLWKLRPFQQRGAR